MSVGPATFIVGRARSGTSLLTALLDDHPELLVLPFETHLFDWAAGTDPVRGVLEQTQLWSTLHTHRPDRKRREVEDALRVAFDDTSAVAERLTGLVCAWAKVSGGDPAKRWVEKTPRHLFELSTLVEWYGPETRILILQRDPRDVIASELKQDPSRSVFTQAVSCRVTHEAMRPWLQSPQVHLVVYEDLVADTEGVMREVCGFLGIAADPAAFRPTSMGSEWEGNSRPQSSLTGCRGGPWAGKSAWSSHLGDHCMNDPDTGPCKDGTTGSAGHLLRRAVGFLQGRGQTGDA